MIMGLRDISNQVVAELHQGQSRNKIYKKLVSLSPADAGKIAYCIASVPENTLRDKYIKHNAILFILLIIYSILNIFSGLPIKPDDPTIFLVITSIIPITFSYFVFKFHGGIYRLAGIWFLIDLVETILITGAPDMMDILKLLDLFIIITLAFFIGRKVFPNLGVLGLLKDDNGQFIL